MKGKESGFQEELILIILESMGWFTFVWAWVLSSPHFMVIGAAIFIYATSGMFGVKIDRLAEEIKNSKNQNGVV